MPATARRFVPAHDQNAPDKGGRNALGRRFGSARAPSPFCRRRSRPRRLCSRKRRRVPPAEPVWASSDNTSDGIHSLSSGQAVTRQVTVTSADFAFCIKAEYVTTGGCGGPPARPRLFQETRGFGHSRNRSRLSSAMARNHHNQTNPTHHKQDDAQVRQCTSIL